jgi:hypothetical protein
MLAPLRYEASSEARNNTRRAALPRRVPSRVKEVVCSLASTGEVKVGIERDQRDVFDAIQSVFQSHDLLITPTLVALPVDG